MSILGYQSNYFDNAAKAISDILFRLQRLEWISVQRKIKSDYDYLMRN